MAIAILLPCSTLAWFSGLSPAMPQGSSAVRTRAKLFRWQALVIELQGGAQVMLMGYPCRFRSTQRSQKAWT